MITLSLLVLAVSGWASSDPRIPAGRAIYAQACAQCHGEDGRGNPEWESEVRPVELTDCGHVPTWDAPERVAALILEGTTTGPKSKAIAGT